MSLNLQLWIRQPADSQVSYFRVIANIKFLPECAKILFSYHLLQFSNLKPQTSNLSSVNLANSWPLERLLYLAAIKLI